MPECRKVHSASGCEHCLKPHLSALKGAGCNTTAECTLCQGFGAVGGARFTTLVQCVEAKKCHEAGSRQNFIGEIPLLHGSGVKTFYLAHATLTYEIRNTHCSFTHTHTHTHTYTHHTHTTRHTPRTSQNRSDALSQNTKASPARWPSCVMY